MTAAEMEKKAVLLLGYTDGSGNIAASTDMRRRMLTIINAVYADLFYALGKKDFKPLLSPDGEIDLPERILNEVMPYGTAAFLAQAESDGERQQYYVTLYNQKRAVLSRTETARDVIPSPTE